MMPKHPPQIATSYYSTVKGNLAGVVTDSKDPVNNPTLKSQSGTTSLTFPLDVTNADQGLGNHGHYIMFHINVQTPAKLGYSPYGALKEGGGLSSWKDASVEHGGAPIENLNVDTSGHARLGFAGEDERQYLASGKGPLINTVEVKEPATTQSPLSIALYMPPTVSVTYTANYTDTEIGAGAAKVAELYRSSGFKEGVGILASDETNREIVDALKKVALASVGAIPGMQGAREVYEKQQGYIMTNRWELAFKGLPKRGFQYTFKMMPRNEKESEEVKKIVKAFKENMLPESVHSVKGFTGKNLKIPNTFDIKYMYSKGENSYLHKISTCVLESMNITYGGERYKTFDGNEAGAPPVETAITLNFKEMELITKQRAQEGY